MKKILIGLLFLWILIFSLIGYTKIGNHPDGETVEHNTDDGQTIILHSFG